MRGCAQTGSHKGPIPTSSPAPTIHGLGGPLRCIVGASGEWMRGVDPCGRPSGVQSTPIPLFEMCWGYQGTSRDISVDGTYRMEGVSIMPIYEYRCLDCGEVFSHLVLTFTDASGQRPCPVCGGEQARRVMSTFTVGGRVDPGPGRTAWPTSWNDTNGGDPETLRYWRKRIEQEAKLEEKYPELRDPSLKSDKQEITSTVTEHSHHGHHHHHDHHSHAEPNASSTSHEH